MSTFDAGERDDKFSDFYTYIKDLGKGAFGLVVLALDKYTQEEVAVKIIKKRSLKRDHVQQLREEAEIMAALNHPHVVKFKHMKETYRRIFLGLEPVSGPNLRDFMQQTAITDVQAREIISQVLDAVKHMHARNIIHRDLKPENILVTGEKPLSVKVADFGLSAQFGTHQPMLTGNCGTLFFMAPEQLGHGYYSKAVDVWSCGVILYMLLAGGAHPIADCDDSTASYPAKLQSLRRKLVHFPEQFPPDFPEGAKDLVQRMLIVKPLSRYTTTQAAKHPWVLQANTAPPLTAFEEIAEYSDLMKLKTLAFAAIFANLFVSVEVKPQSVSTPIQPSVSLRPPKRSLHFMASTKSWRIRTQVSSDLLTLGLQTKSRQTSPCTASPIASYRSFAYK